MTKGYYCDSKAFREPCSISLPEKKTLGRRPSHGLSMCCTGGLFFGVLLPRASVLSPVYVAVSKIFHRLWLLRTRFVPTAGTRVACKRSLRVDATVKLLQKVSVSHVFDFLMLNHRPELTPRLQVVARRPNTIVRQQLHTTNGHGGARWSAFAGHGAAFRGTAYRHST